MKQLVVPSFLLACFIIAVVPAYFIWSKVYKDGVIGRIALSGISFFAFMFLFMAVDEQDHHLTLVTYGFVVSVALFFVWHLFRFHKRVLRGRGVCPPDCPQDRRRSDRRFSE